MCCFFPETSHIFHTVIVRACTVGVFCDRTSFFLTNFAASLAPESLALTVSQILAISAQSSSVLLTACSDSVHWNMQDQHVGLGGRVGERGSGKGVW